MKQKSACFWWSICIGLFLFASFSCGWAQESGKKIRVGYSNYEGFWERDEHIKDGYSGYAYDYLNEIAQYTGWEYEFVCGTWEECCERLKNGEIDLLGMLQETKEREEIYTYGRYPCGTEFAMLYVRADRADIFYEDYEAFGQLQVGLVRGFYQNELFEGYARRHGFSPRTRYYKSWTKAREALQRGEVDAVVGSSLNRVHGCKLVAKFGGSPFYFAAPKAEKALLRQFDEAVEQLQLEKPYLEKQLLEKYYGQTQQGINLRRSEAAFIENNPAIRATGDPFFSPYSALAEDGETYEGVFADVLHRIFRNVSLVEQPVGAPSFYAAAACVKAGEADVLVGVYPSRELGRAYDMKFTQPFMQIKCLLVGRQRMTFHEKGPMNVAVVQEHLGMRHYIEERYPYWTVKAYDTAQACLRAVRSGEADVSLQTVEGVMPILLHQQYGDLEPILTVDAQIPVSIGVSGRMPPELLTTLNKSIAAVHGQAVNDIVLRHTVERARQVSWRDFLSEHAAEIALLCMAFFGTAFAVVLFEKRKKNAELERMAFADQLTGAPNLRKFELDARRFLTRQETARRAVLYFDIDKFKFVNETLGYGRGNEVLRYFAQLFARRLQKDELFARVSDDRFVALLRYEGEAQLRLRLGEFCRAFGKLRSTVFENQRLVLAVGVYVLQAQDQDVDLVLDRANLARKTIKGARNHSIAFYNDEIHRRAAKEKEIESSMEEALANREFCFYVQPKYALGSGAVVGVEALVRWLRADGSLVSPADFVPVFERNGFVVELDFYMFEEACRRLRQWSQSGRQLVPIAVNFSRLHLRERQFVDALKRIAAQYGVTPRYLEIEMTESAFVEDAAGVAELISRVKEAGFVLTMDDFGTGYSSLNLLREVPFDVLKLDKSFLMNKKATPRDQIMISNIVRMAKELDIRVVAEGIETPEQQDFVRETGCDVGQGYLFSRPMPVEEFEAGTWKCDEEGAASV